MRTPLHELVSRYLAARGMSLRALARESGVSHSALSRTLRGRSRATAHLLAAVAPALGCPLRELEAAAAGAAAGESPRHAPHAPAAEEARGAAAPGESGGETWEALRALGVDPSVDAARVRAHLARLAEYAATAEARQVAGEGLARKIAALGARGPVIERLRGLAEIYLDSGGSSAAVRAAAGSAVLYFLLAVDDIDDYIFPVGYLDDAVAVRIAEAEVRRLRAEEDGSAAGGDGAGRAADPDP